MAQEQINDRVWQYFGEKLSEREPLVWCLLGRKAGDNTQVQALARELGAGPWTALVAGGGALVAPLVSLAAPDTVSLP